MKTKFVAFLIGTTMMPMQAWAQDVVMRRPLPNQTTGGEVTPTTPTPSPVPGTPTPTGGTPTPTVNPNGAYGWKLDCTIPKLSCMEAVVDGADTTIREIDAQSCPTTQSDEKNEQARSHGWTPIDAGITADTGTDVCGGGETPTPTGTWPNTAYLAYSYCDAGVTQVGCDGLTAASQQDADSFNLTFTPGEVASCVSQDTTDSFYKSLTEGDDSILAPNAIASKQGVACTPPVQPETRQVDGSVCQSGTPMCMHVDYAVSDANGTKTYDVSQIYENYDDSSCQTPNSSLNDDDRAMLRRNGLTAPGGNACSTPNLYAGNGQCATTTTYDPGWPMSGSVHIDTGFRIDCYAVRNVGTPDLSTSRVDASLCESQTATPEQTAMIATLAPDLVDVKTLDRTCPAVMDMKLNYQRDTVPATKPANSLYGENIRIMDTFSIRGDGWSNFFDIAEYTYTYPYVCTDVEPGTGRRPSYYDPYSANGGSAFKSTLPITRQPCDVEHLKDVNGLKDGSIGVDGNNPLTTESVRADCRNTLNDNQTPSRIAQCGVTYESNNRDTMTVHVRRWRNPAM